MTISKKVCLLGDFAVGKTSLVRRYVYNHFDDRYISTIGVKVSRKTMVVPQAGDGVELALMLWDLAGDNGFHEVRASYLRGAAGAVLVCDLTRPETLDSLQQYVDDLAGASPQARLIVAANKRDLIDQQLTGAQVVEVAARFNATVHLTSAKTGDEVERLFRHLGELLIT
jgi:small GTP-binding protein